MNGAEVIGSFLTGSYAVTRRSPSSYGTDGRLQSPTTTTFTIAACEQPASGRDLQRLPEGSRVSDVVALWTATELRTKGPGQDPDLIAVGADSYEVQNVQEWDTLGEYWKVLALKTGH